MTVTKGKMVDDNTLNGAAGVGLIALRVAQMQQIWHERHIDPGIDGTIELRDTTTGEMTDQHIFVQSKASGRRRPIPSRESEPLVGRIAQCRPSRSDAASWRPA